MLTAEKLAKYISLSEVPEAWEKYWEKCRAKYRNDWLEQYDWDEIINYYDLDETIAQRIKEANTELRQDEILNYLGYLLHYVIYDTESDGGDVWSWNVKENTFSEHGSWKIPLLVMLSGYPLHLQNMKKRHFDDFQVVWQKKIIKSICGFDDRYYHLAGIRFSQMTWGSSFMKGNIIQVGRLQYEMTSTGTEGLMELFPRNTHFISIHIPRDKSLDRKEVTDSLEAAREYICKYCPEWQEKDLVFYTSTWLLSPELEEILPQESNILHFQRLFERVELVESRHDFLQFAFDIPFTQEENALLPERTSLQRNLKQKLLDNQKLHIGIGYLKAKH